MSYRLSALAVGALLLAGAAPADAAGGITVVSPKAGTTIDAGTTPTFKLRVKGSGQVWVHVCASRRKDAKGVICSDESIGRAKRHNGVFRYTPKFFDFPSFWLNSPGTYYWQAHRVACRHGSADCRQEGPIVRIKVS